MVNPKIYSAENADGEHIGPYECQVATFTNQAEQLLSDLTDDKITPEHYQSQISEYHSAYKIRFSHKEADLQALIKLTKLHEDQLATFMFKVEQLLNDLNNDKITPEQYQSKTSIYNTLIEAVMAELNELSSACEIRFSHKEADLQAVTKLTKLYEDQLATFAFKIEQLLNDLNNDRLTPEQYQSKTEIYNTLIEASKAELRELDSKQAAYSVA